MLGRGVGNVLGVGTEEQIERFIPSVIFLFRVSFYLWVGFVLFCFLVVGSLAEVVN